MSSLPPPEHVTNLTSLVPQSLSKAAAVMKSKTSASQSAHLTKPVVEPLRTALPAKQPPSAGFVNSRLSTVSSSAVSSSAVDDSDEEAGDSAADFFSLDAAAAKPATSKSREAVDVRWSGSTSHVQPAATFVPPDITASSANIVWNATNYTSPVADFAAVADIAVVCTYLSLDALIRLFCGCF